MPVQQLFTGGSAVFSNSGMSLGRSGIGDAKRVDLLQKTAV